ncbi:Uncharacterized protein HZ326_13975 [Fusarium oxysporum f. sp. albedinis]|nr:Uncharacterized protein HZ326_13975 [Fusarium oxysporum f. sp. albedinis]
MKFPQPRGSLFKYLLRKSERKMNEHESTSGRQARQGPASSSLSLFTQSGLCISTGIGVSVPRLKKEFPSRKSSTFYGLRRGDT